MDECDITIHLPIYSVIILKEKRIKVSDLLGGEINREFGCDVFASKGN